MINLLEAAARQAPDRTAAITPETAPSYADLLDRACRVGNALRRRNVRRFAVAEPDAATVIAVLAGAALAGAEPCQYQPDTDARDLCAEADALGHRVLVTRRQDVDGEQNLDIIRPDDLVRDEPPSPVAIRDDAPQPILIRTTGTTGAPKAARHDWRVLTQTVAGVRPRPDQRWLLAYGPHQFAGIQVLLHVLASQATLVAPFPRQPKDGLAALIAHDVNCVSATPTFWRFLLAEARSRGDSLPHVEQITLGGEASSSDLLQELRTTFPFAHVSQVYASTEFGSITSVKDGRPGLALDSLWGTHNPASNVRVEDGQLWVRPEAGMLGYEGEAGGATPFEAGEWHPTGDLVEIVGSRVLFRGRQSEVINVGGVKVHPLPVEERILALGCVEAARVFGRPSTLTGAIVAVDIVPAGGVAAADADAIRSAVKGAVAELPRAWQPRSVNLVDAVETRGGKTVRGTGS